MKRALVVASVLAAFAGTQALAQTVGVGPADTVIIEPGQRTTIKEYVLKERVAPVRVKERISVGAALPADVELRTVPSAWGPRLSKYRYVYADDSHCCASDRVNMAENQSGAPKARRFGYCHMNG
jgi:Protein of unknown function (DUF1236)